RGGRADRGRRGAAPRAPCPPRLPGAAGSAGGGAARAPGRRAGGGAARGRDRAVGAGGARRGRGPLGRARARRGRGVPAGAWLGKPVIAAVEGHAVAGGLELALWCDLRVAARDAVFGVYCRRFGVPLIDGGTIRLPRLIGMSHALDLVLTGRGVSGEEALRMGLANRLVEPGRALHAATQLARELAGFPQKCLRSDRASTYEAWTMPLCEAITNECRHGLTTIQSGE